MVATTALAAKHSCHCDCMQPLKVETLVNGKQIWGSGTATATFYVTSCDDCTPEECPVPADINPDQCETRCQTVAPLSFWTCVELWWNPEADDGHLTTHPIPERALVV